MSGGKMIERIQHFIPWKRAGRRAVVSFVLVAPLCAALRELATL
jgi:hypothetical protein